MHINDTPKKQLQVFKTVSKISKNICSCSSVLAFKFLKFFLSALTQLISFYNTNDFCYSQQDEYMYRSEPSASIHKVRFSMSSRPCSLTIGSSCDTVQLFILSFKIFMCTVTAVENWSSLLEAVKHCCKRKGPKKKASFCWLTKKST